MILTLLIAALILTAILLLFIEGASAIDAITARYVAAIIIVLILAATAIQITEILA